jgi:hypothetical protein
MLSVKARNAMLNGGLASQCEDEIVATEKWIKDGHGIDKTERDKNKAGLASALGDRVKGLTAFLGKLKAMRKRLRAHIIRVNIAFSAKSRENKNAMAAAKAATRANKGLHLLTLPAAELAVTAEEQDTMDAGEESSRPVSSGSMAGAGSCVGKTCEGVGESASAAAAKAHVSASFLELSLALDDAEPLSEAGAAKKLANVANRLYEQVIANVQVTRGDLEIERGIFGVFRDKLRAMILKREAKLAKLKAQLSALKAQIAAGGSFAGDVWPLLKEHLKVVQDWQTTAPAISKESSDMELRVIELIKADGVAVAVGGGVAGAGEAAGSEATAAAPVGGGSGVAVAEAKVAPAAGSEANAKPTTMTAEIAVEGYTAENFEGGPSKALETSVDAFLALKAGTTTVEGACKTLPGAGKSAAKCALILQGKMDADSVTSKMDDLSADPTLFLGKLKAAGATDATGITIVEPPRVKEADE